MQVYIRCLESDDVYILLDVTFLLYLFTVVPQSVKLLTVSPLSPLRSASRRQFARG